MAAPVVHFEVAGKDAAKLQAFYADLFGWPVDANNPMNYGIVPAAEGGIAGGIGPSPTGEGHVTFYVAVPDLQAALDKAVSLGGQQATPPMDVPGGPSLAHLLDPAGNFVGLVKDDGTTPPPPGASGNPVAWFEVSGPDGAQLRAFYAALFDWEIDADNPMNYGMIQATDGISGGIGQTQDGSTHITWYVAVPDLEATLQKAESLGGKTIFGPDQVPDGPRIAMFTDPEGNVIGAMTLPGGPGE